METATKIPVVVYAESTPNPSAMKFVVNKPIVPLGDTYDFKDFAATKNSPLAQQLFRFSFVKGIFISGNYVTLTKVDGIEWSDVMGHVRDFMKIFIEEGSSAVIQEPRTKSQEPSTSSDLMHHTTPSGTVEEKIVGILEEYIRPAVENDGGLISFKSFNDGLVTVILKGSCSGCPSSKITLKAGIEGLLKRMIPEVQQVVAEEA